MFIIISLYTGYYHEPWADEAQSWLIARDASFSEIVFDIAKYEGTPSLWQILLKIFILFGLQYEQFYLVSVFFSVIGVWIIVNKLKISNIYKILLPFTYFILYEYTVKARSYCLLLPVLAGIAWIHENRKTHIFFYNFLLGILATISLHGSIISGILYLFEISEIFKELGKNGNVENNKKECICIVILTLLYSFILFSIFPSSDLYINVGFFEIVDIESFTSFGVSRIIKILEAFVLVYDYLAFLLIPSIIFVILLFVFILKGNNNKKLFLSIFLSVTLFICLVRVAGQHIGLIFYTFLFSLYLIKDDILEKNKKILNILIIIMFVIQIIWSGYAIKNEVKYTYSAGKDVSEYLKTLNYEELDICALGYYSTSILPYFDENIFDNDRGGKSWYVWSIHNLDWYKSSSKEYLYQESTNKKPDIIIMYNTYENECVYNTLLVKIKNSNEYDEKFFEGIHLLKGMNDEKEGFYVFKKIN